MLATVNDSQDMTSINVRVNVPVTATGIVLLRIPLLTTISSI